MKKRLYLIIVFLIVSTTALITPTTALAGASLDASINTGNCTFTLNYSGSVSITKTVTVGPGDPGFPIPPFEGPGWYVGVYAATADGGLVTNVSYLGDTSSVMGTYSATVPAGSYGSWVAGFGYVTSFGAPPLAYVIKVVEDPFTCTESVTPPDVIVRPPGDPFAPSSGHRGFVDIIDALTGGVLVEGVVAPNVHEWGYWTEEDGYQVLGWAKLNEDGTLEIVLAPGCPLAYEHFVQIVAENSVSGYSLAPAD
ncbi:MAG: hypothetical protein JW966_12940 [Anaerolineae bacterium]|nr:hypothetical protein [Anaerolineae bacterium]